MSWLNLSIAVLCLIGIGLVGYPTAAGWVSQYNQSNILFDQTQATAAQAREELRAQLDAAQAYNEALHSGALLESGANVASGTGVTETTLDYWKLLAGESSTIMSRLRIPAIDLDLPVYHGTSDATLLKGVGHLQGTSLPVGGEGTRSVLTGHRGLANATMFTHLDRVKKGDVFSVEVLGEVLSYRVDTIQIVDPDATEQIRAEPGRDLMTLVTCTPLGINTQRILITGERVIPTPHGEIEAMSAKPDVPGFPWWIVIGGGLVVGVGVWFWRSGYRSVPPAKTALQGASAGVLAPTGTQRAGRARTASARQQ